MFKLYHHPASTCSQKVRLALAEKKLDYEQHILDFTRLEQLEDWYLALNPNGVAPTLVHDDVPILDSSVICEYLDEVIESHSLAPRSAADRAAMRAWMRYFEEVPTNAIRIPSFNLYLGRVIKGTHSPEQFDAMVAKTPLRKQFYRSITETGFPEAVFADSLDRLRQCLVRVERALSDGRPFLLGEQYSIADIVLVPTVVRMQDLKLSHLWQDLPGVARWVSIVEARPSFAIAFPPAARVDPQSYKLSQGNAA